MSLRVYNTLTRTKEEFRTVEPGKVGMYLCGPTVYKPSHVGHMVGPVIFDTVKRYLSYVGFKVTFVVNITDVDDKIINEANKQKRDWKAVAEEVTTDYLENLRRLGVTSIDHFPRATDHIPDMHAMMQALIDKGYAYPAGGDVYFDVTKDDDYGKLCNRDPEQLEAGARIEVSEKKRNPGDFALWKGAKPGEPSWPSPWGPGRPGWHIECSAMAGKIIGKTLDIHGGGLDLQFPHHENELAQSESCNGQIFARYWMHNGLMKTGDKKMAKSEGNEVVVTPLLQKHQPETLRFLLLSSHYRSPIEYSEKRLDELAVSLKSFHQFAQRFEKITGSSFYTLEAPARRKAMEPTGGPNAEFVAEVVRYREAFLALMDDDFNTGGAIGVLFELLKSLRRFVSDRNLETGTPDPAAVADLRRGGVVLRELTNILGLFQSAPEAPKEEKGGRDELVGGLMQILIELRAEAKKAKNFAQADQIRERLKALNVTLEDRPGGKTEWKLG